MLISSSSAFVRRGVFDLVGLFDERIVWLPDTDMWYRIALEFSILEENQLGEWICITIN